MWVGIRDMENKSTSIDKTTPNFRPGFHLIGLPQKNNLFIFLNFIWLRETSAWDIFIVSTHMQSGFLLQ